MGNKPVAPASRHVPKIVAVIRAQMPGVVLIYLFGSRATGQTNPGSDWDIAVLGSDKLSAETRWQLSSELSDCLSAEVDLVDLREASTVLKMQVVEKGQLLFDSVGYASEFEACTMSMYGNLQEARADIIDNFVRYIVKKGKQHA